MKKNKVLGIIPARYESTRLPGKPLKIIHGKTMIHRVYEITEASKTIDMTIVATDDKRIINEVKRFGGNSVLTSKKCKSGTDRMYEVICKMKKSYNVIVNIQGDEPLLKPIMIDKTVSPLINCPKLQVTTLAVKFKTMSELKNPNHVKVILNKENEAIYFSRSIIPFNRQKPLNPGNYYKHIGLYAFRKRALVRFIGLKQSNLEKSEKLEQLRLIENKIPVKVIITRYDTIGVDTLSDLKKVSSVLSRKK